MASVTDPVTGAVSYTYAPQGHRLTVTLPGGGTWSYGYRAGWYALPAADPEKLAPALEKVTDDQGREVRSWQDTLGRLHEAQQILAPSVDVHTGYSYDVSATGNSRGLLLQVKNQRTRPGPMGPVTELLVQNGYTYDNSGQRLTNTITDAGGARTESYGYDELSRLTSVNYGDGQTQGYTFDAMGNRLTKTDSVTGAESYTYNAANMLLTRNGAAYTNDANGNTLTGGGRVNTWDGQNRLVQRSRITGRDRVRGNAAPIPIVC